MKKYTKLSMQWFYSLLEKGECDMMDFKEQLEDKRAFGKSHKNFAPNYEEMARDVVAYANLKGGFLFVGIVDGTKEVNQDFKYDNQKVFDLIKQVQDRTFPTITLIPHTLKVSGRELLLLEIPFSNQMHRTSRGEFLIRSNDGNRPIEPYEMSTILAEKGMIVYDQQTWKVCGDWIDPKRLARLRDLIEAKNSESPYLDKTDDDLLDSLGMTREENDGILPTTTGLLFIGSLLYENKTGRALKLDQLFVLSEIVKRGKITLTGLADSPNISQYRLQTILDNLQELEFIESTGKTSGLAYILHVSKRKSTEEKIDYVKRKKQNKARQKEAILRYLDSIDTINNTEARELLKLQVKDRSMVSRLFAELVKENEIEQTEDSIPNNVKYRRKRN